MGPNNSIPNLADTHAMHIYSRSIALPNAQTEPSGDRINQKGFYHPRGVILSAQSRYRNQNVYPHFEND
jgi:hypothetical protein